MKAFLLVAGLGTRLRPITDTIPKCLVKVQGRPMLDWWYDSMERAGITEVLINLHHLPEQVVAHVKDRVTPIQTHFFMEETLLGSAGTLRANYDFVKEEKSFFIIYGDNLTTLSLTDFRKFHESQPHPMSVALFRSQRPENCGIAELDTHHTVIDFVEKPKQPRSNLANAGIYIASPEIINAIPGDKSPCDIGFDLLPLFIGKMSGWTTEDYLIDIGTHENLEKAEREFLI